MGSRTALGREPRSPGGHFKPESLFVLVTLVRIIFVLRVVIFIVVVVLIVFVPVLGLS